MIFKLGWWVETFIVTKALVDLYSIYGIVKFSLEFDLLKEDFEMALKTERYIVYVADGSPIELSYHGEDLIEQVLIFRFFFIL